MDFTTLAPPRWATPIGLTSSRENGPTSNRDQQPTLAAAPRQIITIGLLRDRYLATHGNGTIEANSLDTCKLHLRHFCRVLGDSSPLGELSLGRLQEYVSNRAEAKVSPVTIRKEIATLRAAWNRGEPMGLTAGKFPNRGLRYPKADEKPPFMTMAEIKRQLRGGADPDLLWEALYLQASELTELLAHVKEKAPHPWIYPLFCFAAHTGTRRSEILRALVADVDFEGNSVLVREKKRTRGQRTTRRVPLTPFLKEVLKEWLAIHPGGPALFATSKPQDVAYLERLTQEAIEKFRLWRSSQPASDWQRLDTSKPDAHPGLVDEMMSSDQIIGFGRRLHCYLVPERALIDINRTELEARQVERELIGPLIQEKQAVLRALFDKCRQYRFENYRALGVGESLLETLRRDDLDKLFCNLQENRDRGALGLLAPPVFDKLSVAIKKTCKFPNFSSVTIHGNRGRYYRAILWTDAGVFFTHDEAIIEQLRGLLVEHGFRQALGFENDWREPSPRVMSAVNDAVIRHFARFTRSRPR